MMNDKEIVSALRNCKAYKTKYGLQIAVYDLQIAMIRAADLIETLQAQLAASQRRAQDARNELCLKCGRYRESHKGVCNGCRWKE